MASIACQWQKGSRRNTGGSWKRNDPESYLSSAGSLAAESFRHQVHNFKNSPEQQKLPHLDRMRALQNHLELVREQIMHDHILQPVPE